MNEKKKDSSSDLAIRYTEPEDAIYFKKWLQDPETLEGFPMLGEQEIEDAVIRWISFHRFKCSLTVLKNGVPCGIATLYLQPYKRVSHQCDFGIVVSKECRNQGVGSYLLNALLHLAKTKFHIEIIHLQVHEGNSAKYLYEKFGFKVFAVQEKWLKDGDRYCSRLYMQRSL